MSHARDCLLFSAFMGVLVFHGTCQNLAALGASSTAAPKQSNISNSASNSAHTTAIPIDVACCADWTLDNYYVSVILLYNVTEVTR